MDVGKLVYMANQIGANFRAQGEAVAEAATADHLRRFWDPRMRREIIAHLAAGGKGMTPLARAAVGALASPGGES